MPGFCPQSQGYEKSDSVSVLLSFLQSHRLDRFLTKSFLQAAQSASNGILGTPSKIYGLYRIPSATCPSGPSESGVDLIVTPASSPNTQGAVNTTLNAPGQA